MNKKSEKNSISEWKWKELFLSLFSLFFGIFFVSNKKSEKNSILEWKWKELFALLLFGIFFVLWGIFSFFLECKNIAITSNLVLRLLTIRIEDWEILDISTRPYFSVLLGYTLFFIAFILSIYNVMKRLSKVKKIEGRCFKI